MGIGKKILVGFGVLFLVIIAIVVIIGGVFLATVGKDISEKEELLEGLTPEQKLAIGSMIDNCKSNTGYLQSLETGELIEKKCMEKVQEKISEMKGE